MPLIYCKDLRMLRAIAYRLQISPPQMALSPITVMVLTLLSQQLTITELSILSITSLMVRGELPWQRIVLTLPQSMIRLRLMILVCLCMYPKKNSLRLRNLLVFFLAHIVMRKVLTLFLGQKCSLQLKSQPCLSLGFYTSMG